MTRSTVQGVLVHSAGVYVMCQKRPQGWSQGGHAQGVLTAIYKYVAQHNCRPNQMYRQLLSRIDAVLWALLTVACCGLHLAGLSATWKHAIAPHLCKSSAWAQSTQQHLAYNLLHLLPTDCSQSWAGRHFQPGRIGPPPMCLLALLLVMVLIWPCSCPGVDHVCP